MCLTHTSLSCIIKNINQLMGVKKMTIFQKAILKRIDIFLKMFSNYLVIKTLDSSVKKLTDEHIEKIVPIVSSKLKTMNKNIYDN